MFKKVVFLSVIFLSFPSLSSAFEASYYADMFEGRSTANGNIFSQENHSAAICYEELGQLAYVSTADAGIVVNLDDRPNCSRYADSVDLSSSAFSTLAPLSQGRISGVSAVPIGIKTGKFIKRNISQKEFLPLGIELTSKISNTYFTSDIILIQGKVTNNAKQAILLLVGKTTGKQVVEAAGLDSRGNFSFFLHFPDSDEEYYFVIASGNTANTKDAVSLKLIKKESITYPERKTASVSLIPKLTPGDIPGIKLSKNLWASMEVSQNNKTHSVQGGFLSFSGNTFVPGAAQVSISGYTLSTPSSLDRNKYIPTMFSGTVLLDRTRDSIGQEKVLIRTTKTLGIFRFRLGEGVRVRSTYYVTLPSGDVREYSLAKKYDAGDGYLKTGIWIAGNFPIKDTGTYKFELVQEDGFAYVNIPVYQGRIWGVVPTLSDDEMFSINTDVSRVRAETVEAVNALRSTLGRTQLIHSTTLDTLAQKKAEYMAKNNDLNHVTRDGRDIGSFAKELGISVQGGIAENIAGGKNVSALVLQDGLEESGSHRKAMLSPNYTKIGIGYVVIDSSTYMVQVFGN